MEYRVSSSPCNVIFNFHREFKDAGIPRPLFTINDIPNWQSQSNSIISKLSSNSKLACPSSDNSFLLQNPEQFYIMLTHHIQKKNSTALELAAVFGNVELIQYLFASKNYDYNYEIALSNSVQILSFFH